MHCTVTVQSVDHPRMCCPAVVSLPEPDDAPAWRLYATDQQGRATHEIEAQWNPQDHTLSWMIDYLDAGQPVRYLARSGSMPDASNIVLNDEEGRLDILRHGKLLTSYVYAHPSGSAEIVRPYFWPVVGPNGQRLTRDFPMEAAAEGDSNDHPHHRSFWVAHGDINGTDNWSEGPEHGWQSHQAFVDRVEGGVYGKLTAYIVWTTKDRQPQLGERRTLFVYDTPGMFTLMDLIIEMKALHEDLVFGDTKEGGLISFRVADSIRGKTSGTLINSRGQSSAELWGKPAEWVDNTGTIGGISLLDHPANLRYPTTWHARDYGLVTANPFGWHDFEPESGKRGDYTLPHGETLTMRYRVILHDDRFTGEDVARAHLDWSYPPQITVE